MQFQLRMATQQRERTDTVAKELDIRSGNLDGDSVRELERELAEMKDRLLSEQRLETELRYREGEVTNTLAGEHNRCIAFNSRLDDLERALTGSR